MPEQIDTPAAIAEAYRLLSRAAQDRRLLRTTRKQLADLATKTYTFYPRVEVEINNGSIK